MTTPTQTVTAADLLPELATPRPPSAPPADAAPPKPIADDAALPAVVSDPTDIPAESTGDVRPGELDGNGTPFDPARHIPKKHPRTDRWMPRGGRKRKPKPAPAVPASSSPSTSASPNASSGDSQASPPAAAPVIPEVGPSDSPAGEGVGSGSSGSGNGANGGGDAGPAGDAELSPNAAGELAARVLYGVTGAVTGDHKRATATGAEHESIKKTASAFFAYRGIKMVGWLALGGATVAYFLSENRREFLADKVRAFVAKKTPAKPAARDDTIDIAPAADPAPAAKSTGESNPPQAAPADSPFAGRGL